MALTLHRRRCPRPVALISRGTTPAVCRCGGVEAPTAAASLQCVFGKANLMRLYFVNPPDPTSMGSPVALRRSNKHQRVTLTAVASLREALACMRIRSAGRIMGKEHTDVL